MYLPTASCILFLANSIATQLLGIFPRDKFYNTNKDKLLETNGLEMVVYYGLTP